MDGPLYDRFVSLVVDHLGDSMVKEIKHPTLGIISYYTGYIIVGMSLFMILPASASALFREWNVVLDFLISLFISLSLGMVLVLFGRNTRLHNGRLMWKHGFVVASLSWFVLMFLCAIPYLLSGHMNSLLDATFDVMSGFTTTGVFLLQDLDHISIGLNLWRHMLTFIGGQGMVVLALSFLVREMAGAYKFYVGEGKDVALVPNVRGTTQIIWIISMVYLFIGTSTLFITGLLIGLNPTNAFLHGLFMFMAGWSTGGFAPNQQNIMFYHSFSFEVVSILFFVLGSMNFGLHYAIIKGKKMEFLKNIEIQSFLITSLTGSAIAAVALAKSGLYSDSVALFRRVVFNIVSANTTTGFGTVFARQFILEWGPLGMLAITLVMLVGGSACSTAGGFKGLRVGIVVKAFFADMRKLLTSERRVKIEKYHHIKDMVLDDAVVRTSSTIIFLYLLMFTGATMLGAYFGYPVVDSMFEAASISGNVGLSIGITATTMPSAMKIYYIFAMYLGRLEFLSVFALIGVMAQGVKTWLKRA